MKTKDIVAISLGVCLLTIAAQFKLHMYAVPFSLQLTMVFLLSFALPFKQSFFSILLYMLMGLLGFPVFASGGGFMYIMKPGFGFLLGFLAIPVVCHLTLPKKEPTALQYFFSGMLAWITLYGIALPYCYVLTKTVLALSMTLPAFLMAFCLVFLPGDCLGILLSSSVSRTLRKTNVLK